MKAKFCAALIACVLVFAPAAVGATTCKYHPWKCHPKTTTTVKPPKTTTTKPPTTLPPTTTPPTSPPTTAGTPTTEPAQTSSTVVEREGDHPVPALPAEVVTATPSFTG